MSNLRSSSASETAQLDYFKSKSSGRKAVSLTAASNITTAAAATSTTEQHLYNNNNSIRNKVNNIHPQLVGADVAVQIDEADTVSTVANKRFPHSTTHIFGRIFVDLCLISCIGLPILGFSLWVTPYERGYFCSDLSLRHPYRESTIRSWVLFVVCAVVPVSVVLLIEFYRGQEDCKKSKHCHDHCHYFGSGCFLFHKELPQWLLECYRKIGAFALGLGLEQLTTDITKYSIGRLRPHFYFLCQPVPLDGTTCSDSVNAGRYIDEFTCSAANITAKKLKDMRLSFPSGHASFACFSMIYLVMYLQRRFHWTHLRFVRHFMQFLLLMFAWYTSLTRVSDYKHHWSDVVAGGVIGLTYAVLVVCISLRCTPYNIDQLNAVQVSSS